MGVWINFLINDDIGVWESLKNLNEWFHEIITTIKYVQLYFLKRDR